MKWPSHIKAGGKKRGKMNKLEARYAQDLEMLKRAGEIQDYWYEGIKFRLAEGAIYTPDFVVWEKDDTITVHEVKGFQRTAGRVRIKVAAETYPFRFKQITKNGEGWNVEEI